MSTERLQLSTGMSTGTSPVDTIGPRLDYLQHFCLASCLDPLSAQGLHRGLFTRVWELVAVSVHSFPHSSAGSPGLTCGMDREILQTTDYLPHRKQQKLFIL